MNFNRIALLVSLLLLIFFVFTSAGLADISAVQDQLRALQLKLVGQKVKQLQDQILQVGHPAPPAPAPVAEPVLSPEEISRQIQNQIDALQSLVASLSPRAFDEQTAALEARISRINQAIQTAVGPQLAQLQNDLASALADYDALRLKVKSALDESMKEQQAAALRQQIRVLQEKILLLPKPVPQAPLQFAVLEDEIQKAKLKLVSAQMRAIRQKVDELKNQ